MLRKRKAGSVVLIVSWSLAAPALCGAQFIMDGVFPWYVVVPFETWKGRAMIIMLVAGGVFSLHKAFKTHRPGRLRYCLSAAVLLLSAAVLANIQIRQDTWRIGLHTNFQVHVRNHNIRLL